MEEKKSSLKRELGFFSMVAIIVGQMIGSGIYMAPQGLAELANPVAAVLAILITGVGTVFLSISFARKVEVVETYDRSKLIDRAVDNLQVKLIEEFVVVALVCAVFLFHLRSALVAVGLYLLLNRTRIGTAMRGSGRPAFFWKTL